MRYPLEIRRAWRRRFLVRKIGCVDDLEVDILERWVLVCVVGGENLGGLRACRLDIVAEVEGQLLAIQEIPGDNRIAMPLFQIDEKRRRLRPVREATASPVRLHLEQMSPGSHVDVRTKPKCPGHGKAIDRFDVRIAHEGGAQFGEFLFR